MLRIGCLVQMQKLMTNVVVIADFFVEHVLGGGEINNEELINILSSEGVVVHKIQSHLATEQLINNFAASVFIIGNFVNLKQPVREALFDKEYII